MVFVMIVPLVVVGAVVVLVLRRGGRDPEPARLVQVTALGLAGVVGVLIGLFILGETFTDPGGWAAVGLAATWVVPLVALSLLAWFRPGPATWVLGVLGAAVVALGLWYAVDSAAWRSFEDDVGPVRTIAAFALLIPLAVLGRTRALAAGALLLVVSVVPPVLAVLGSGGAMASLAAVSAPGALVGTLLLLAGLLQRQADGAPGSGGHPLPSVPA